MRQLDLKKLLLPNLPYLLIGLYATKLGEAWRLAPGVDASAKLLGLMDGFAAAFQSALPSFHPVDLLVGLCCGAALRLAVYFKGKNAKKYRKNMEYGSARWGDRTGCHHRGYRLGRSRSYQRLRHDRPDPHRADQYFPRIGSCGFGAMLASPLLRLPVHHTSDNASYRATDGYIFKACH